MATAASFSTLAEFEDGPEGFVAWAWVMWACELADRRPACDIKTDRDVVQWARSRFAHDANVQARAQTAFTCASTVWPEGVPDPKPKPVSRPVPDSVTVPIPKPDRVPAPALQAKAPPAPKRVAKLLGPCGDFPCGQRPWKDCMAQVQALLAPDAAPAEFEGAKPWLVHLADLHLRKGEGVDSSNTTREPVTDLTRVIQKTRVKVLTVPGGHSLTVSGLRQALV